MTTYGLGPQVEAYEAPTGAPVLRIPSYGMVAGEDRSLRAAERKVVWILWRAGVDVLLVGGTSGTWDGREGEEAVRPRSSAASLFLFSPTIRRIGIPPGSLQGSRCRVPRESAYRVP